MQSASTTACVEASVAAHGVGVCMKAGCHVPRSASVIIGCDTRIFLLVVSRILLVVMVMLHQHEHVIYTRVVYTFTAWQLDVYLCVNTGYHAGQAGSQSVQIGFMPYSLQQGCCQHCSANVLRSSAKLMGSSQTVAVMLEVSAHLLFCR